MTMSPVEASAPPEPPRGHVRVVYLGPVAPHWEVDSQFGDRALVEAFRERALARLVLLPPHDPQFRRNRERVVRDAERENLLLEWDLGIPEEEPAPRVADEAEPAGAAAEESGAGAGEGSAPSEAPGA